MVLERVLDFFEHVVAEHNGDSVVAVAHGDILVFPWLHAQGVEPEALMKDKLVEYALPLDYPGDGVDHDLRAGGLTAPPVATGDIYLSLRRQKL